MQCSKHHSHRRLLWTALLFLVAAAGLVAQPRMQIQANGDIVDSKTGEPLISAAVQVTTADGGTGTFGISDTLGHFVIDLQRPGKYTFSITYMGYKPYIKEINVFPGRGANLGKFKMDEDPEYLEEVVTVARAQRMKQVGDTVVYNADAYKVQDGASAEELVAKMPGIEVTDEGVKAQGETVEKITVDGKAFFENDPKLALKTLPAEVVQSVRVFDQKSDQAEFTGFDDGETVKAMDLETKAWRRNGAFGKVYGSLGSDFGFDDKFYNAGFNLNIFAGNRRISMLGMSNNVNQQNFSFDDLQATGGMGGRGGGMGARVGNQSGVSRANAFGLNYNDSFLDDKLEVQGSYFFNGTRTVLDQETQDDYINTARAGISTTDRLSHNFSNRIDMRITYKPSERDEIRFRPSFNLQRNDQDGYSTNTVWRHGLEDVMNDPILFRDSIQTRTTTKTDSESQSWNAGGNLTWRHRFDKAGRTISIAANARVSGSETDADYVKTYNYRGQDYQRNNSDTKNFRGGGNVMWTEPIDSTQQLSLRYELNYTRSQNDRLVAYYEDESFAMQDSIDRRNSNEYTTKYLTNAAEVGWRLNRGAWRANAALRFQNAQLDGEQDYKYWDVETMGRDTLSYTTAKSFNSLLPSGRIEWRPVPNTNVQLTYRASSSNPSIQNLQQTVNTTNELNYSTGNPDLGQSVGHNVRLSFMHTNMEKATNFMVFAGFNATRDDIGTQYVTNNTDRTIPVSLLPGYQSSRFAGLGLVSGGRISMPVNMSGSQRLFSGVVYGFPLDLIYSNVNFGVDVNYSRTPSRQVYVDGFDYDEQLGEYRITGISDLDAKIQNFSVSPRLHVSSNISQDLDFSLSYRPSFSKIKDVVNTANNYTQQNHRASFRLNWTFWQGFTMEQQLNYTCHAGSVMVNGAEDEWIWNASLGRKFLKGNKAELKLQAYDLLNSNKGFSQNVSDSYVRTSYVNFMPRYVMLTFSYKIANYKGSSELKSSSRRAAGGPGGPGGGPGGPM